MDAQAQYNPHHGRALGGLAPANKQIGQLDQIQLQLDSTLKSLHEITLRAREIGNRLLGAQPEAMQAAGNEPRTVSTTGRLEETAGYLSTTVSELSSQLARLERL